MWPCASSGSPHLGQGGRPAVTTRTARSTNARAIWPSIRIRTRSGPSGSSSSVSLGVARRPRDGRRLDDTTPPHRPRSGPWRPPGTPRRAARRAARHRADPDPSPTGCRPVAIRAVEERVELLEDGHLGLLQADAHDVPPLRAWRKNAAAGLTDRAGDEPVGPSNVKMRRAMAPTLRHLPGPAGRSGPGRRLLARRFETRRSAGTPPTSLTRRTLGRAPS